MGNIQSGVNMKNWIQNFSLCMIVFSFKMPSILVYSRSACFGIVISPSKKLGDFFAYPTFAFSLKLLQNFSF